MPFLLNLPPLRKSYLSMLAVDSITDNRQMRALTGLDMAAFCALIVPFAVGCQQEADARFADQRPCQRRAGGGRKGRLASAEQKFLFILDYLKSHLPSTCWPPALAYPTLRQHAHRLARALERSLRALGMLPPRAIESLAQMQQVFADVPVLLLDATERPHHPVLGWTGPPTTQVKKRLTRKIA